MSPVPPYRASRRQPAGMPVQVVWCLCAWLCLVAGPAGCARGGDPVPAEGRLVSSLAALTRHGLGRETRLCLPAARMRLPVSIPPGAVLKIGFGVDRGPRSLGPQVEEFSATFVADGQRTTLLRRILNADDNDWQDADVPLDPVGGRQGVIELDHRTLRGAVLGDGNAYWTNPTIAPVPRHAGPNIILLSIDTLRADHLACYGYARDTSPNIDRLAREGILFRQAIAPASWTLPSHASMLTGLYPFHHGAVRFKNPSPLRPSLTTVAEVLWNAGYATAAYTGGGFVSASLGFDQGFNRYWSENGENDLNLVSDEMDANVDRALSWIQDQGSRRFFLFLHTYSVHLPYAPPAAFNVFDPGYDGPFKAKFTGREKLSYALGVHDLDARTVRHIEALYDGGIRHLDAIVGRLMAALRRRADDTCLILTADHGEEFNEHGNILHRQPKLYDELLHVPLIVWCPSRYGGGRSIEQPVSIVDVTPTLLEIAGARIPDGLDGISLEAALAGREQAFPPATLSEVDRSLIGKPGTVRALRTARAKLIVSEAEGSARLFDLQRDPGETLDLRTARPITASRLAKALTALVGSGPTKPLVSVGTAKPDRATIERLRALGYYP